MKTILGAGLIIMTALMLSGASVAADTSEPVYHDGEAWTFEFGGTSEAFEKGKYVVRRQKGSFRMYRINTQGKEESLDSDYQTMLFRLMPFVARSDEYQWLKFPLNKKREFQYTYEWGRSFVYVDATVTMKGNKTILFKGENLEVVELEREESMAFGTKETKYTYCPRTKSVMSASSVRIGGRVDGMTYTVKLVDYNVK